MADAPLVGVGEGPTGNGTGIVEDDLAQQRALVADLLGQQARVDAVQACTPCMLEWAE